MTVPPDLRGLDALGDAIIAEHEAAQQLYWFALAFVRSVAGGQKLWAIEATRGSQVSGLRMLAATALLLVHRLGEDVGELRVDELIDRMLEEAPPSWHESSS